MDADEDGLDSTEEDGDGNAPTGADKDIAWLDDQIHDLQQDHQQEDTIMGDPGSHNKRGLAQLKASEQPSSSEQPATKWVPMSSLTAALGGQPSNDQN